MSTLHLLQYTHVWSTFVAQEWVSACFWMFLTFRIICSVGTVQHVPSASGKVVKCYSVVVARHETLGGSSRWLRPKSLLHVLHEWCNQCAFTICKPAIPWWFAFWCCGQCSRCVMVVVPWDFCFLVWHLFCRRSTRALVPRMYSPILEELSSALKQATEPWLHMVALQMSARSTTALNIIKTCLRLHQF